MVENNLKSHPDIRLKLTQLCKAALPLEKYMKNIIIWYSSCYSFLVSRQGPKPLD